VNLKLLVRTVGIVEIVLSAETVGIVLSAANVEANVEDEAVVVEVVEGDAAAMTVTLVLTGTALQE
jgi:hypothetical protein